MHGLIIKYFTCALEKQNCYGKLQIVLFVIPILR